MKYLKQFGIILLISFAGEALSAALPLPVPGSIYGIVILFVGLQSGLIPLSAVRETGMFLIAMLPLIFIAPSAGILGVWDVFRPIWLPCTVIAVVSTVAVMAVSGRLTQRLMRRRHGRKDK